MRSWKFALFAASCLFGLGQAASAQSLSTQCVSNALAGGTVNAITVPLLPCAFSTNILLLTTSGANTSTAVTLQMAGYPAQPVLRSDKSTLQVGDLPGPGAVVELTSTGTSWLLLNTLYSFSGTLAVANGGTGDSSLTAHGVLIGEGTSPVAVTTPGTTGQVLTGVTGSDPTFQSLTGVVSSLSFGTTGLTPNTATTGAVVVGGILGVPNGGSGVGTLTGVLKGNGTSAFSAATAGTDFVAPGTATTFTAKQTFNGTSSNLASALVNAAEPSTISATAATGTVNYDVCTQSVLYYTTSASANWTLNLRCSSGTALNTAMLTGDTVTVTFLVTQGASPFFNNVLQVDGTGVTPKCQGGTCPIAGNASGIDIYTYAIVKTGSAAFTVLESQTQFK